MTRRLGWLLFVLLAVAVPATAQSPSTGPRDLDAANECAILDVGGLGTAVVDVRGTWVGTLTITGQGPGGTRLTHRLTTANGVWAVGVSGYRSVTACMTSYTSGTAYVSLSAASSVNRIDRYPNTWTASLDDIGATLTEIRAAPGAGLALYLTGYMAGSTTSTAGLHLLRRGTGTNCATGPTTLFPGTGGTARVPSPANTAAPTVVQFDPPLRVEGNEAVCLLGVATNTTWMVLSGFTAP